MNLKNLSDQKLLIDTEMLVQSEREILTSVLYHLREIDRRKLYSALKYKSLFEYSVKKLGYPEDAAYRRINAMRMLKSFSEVESKALEKKITEGTLCLTHLSMAQSLIRKEEKIQKVSVEQKLEILSKLENTTTREAEKVVMSFSSATPEEIVKERIRPLTEEVSELKCSVTKEQLEKIEKLKGLLAHKNPKMNFSELLDVLLDTTIEKLDPAKKEVRPRKERKFAAPKKLCVNNQQQKKRGRYIPAPIKREVWRKHQSKCVNCESTFALEIDHILPSAHGGASTSGNLRLVCRSCNLRAGVKKFGVEKMLR